MHVDVGRRCRSSACMYISSMSPPRSRVTEKAVLCTSAMVAAPSAEAACWADLFATVDAGLVSGESLWRPKPWRTLPVPWRHTHQQLHRDVLRLSDLELEGLQADDEALYDWLSVRVPPFKLMAEASSTLHAAASSCAPSVQRARGRAHAGVPGKKWAQVEAFAAAVPKRRLPAIEWCSGKGFLSQRLLAHGTVSSSVCLEIDASLVQKGQELASRKALPLTFVQWDCLGAEPLPPGAGAEERAAHVALHACGGLHRQMVRSAVLAGAGQVAVAPCCYHRHPTGEHWHPLSRTAAASRLSLSQSDLKLASAGECAAKRRDQRLREREQHWRLAFAAWHRRAHARKGGGGRSDEKVDWARASRLPSVPTPLLSQGSSSEATLNGFKSFCEWGAMADGESLPTRSMLGSALGAWTEREARLCLALGAAQSARIARLELVRQAFRRPLEIWLILDLCLYLEEEGYAVHVAEICARSLSNRNLMVLGQ